MRQIELATRFQNSMEMTSPDRTRGAGTGSIRYRIASVNWWKRAGAVCLFCGAAIAAPAQTFNTLVDFTGGNGAGPDRATLVQGFDGNFYGTTFGGGTDDSCSYFVFVGCGTVFKINSAGTLTTLYSFDDTNGSEPSAALLQTADGTLYGTTHAGGTYGYGTFFKFAPAGKLTTLHSFDSTDGANVDAPVVQGNDGNFYGTSYLGGAYGYGTVYKITPQGALTTLHSFDSTDGANPVAALVLGSDGNFYGTTFGGGANDLGTVFKITPGGTLTTLYSFCAQTNCSDGTSPYTALIQVPNGGLYGTAAYGGANSYGTIFKISTAGALKTLHSFDLTDGSYPAGLTLATDGNIYGITLVGGANESCTSLGLVGCGAAFKITQGGSFSTLYNFCSESGCADGEAPASAFFQATNGTLYGTTYLGGSNGDGTVFSLSVGLVPFVETLPSFGKVGTTIKILGNSLTGATSVTFNGTAATFKVVSASLITATVPTGATTGTVEVTISGATLSSNLPFRVR